jgi:hypothetical protein
VTNQEPEQASDETSATTEGCRAEDEERAHRQHIAETGEPKRDRLGNAEGAS